jgi:hypothetical protein
MSKHNLIYIVVDSLRPDYLSCYDSSKNQTPSIDRLAKSGLIFNNVFSVSTVTPVVFSTLFTGTFPYEHGIKEFSYVLSDKNKTLAELFKSKNYRTGAVVGSVVLDGSRGFSRGFDYYDDKFDKKYYIKDRKVFNDYNNEVIYRLGEVVIEKAKNWIDKSQHENFFLFLHFWDNHLPYNPPESLLGEKEVNYSGKADGSVVLAENYNAENETLDKEDLDQYKALYGGATRHVDNCIEKLIRYLEDNNLMENTSIIFTADHGEALGEYSYIGHGRLLYDRIIQVPLIMHGEIANQYENSVIEKNTSNADIFQNIVNAFYLADKKDLQKKEEIYCETYFPKKFENKRICLRNNEWKYIREPFTVNDGGKKNYWQFTKIFVKRFVNSKGSRVFLLRKLFDRFISKNKEQLWNDIENVLEKRRGVRRELYYIKEDFLEQNNLISKKLDVAKKMDDLLKSRLSGENQGEKNDISKTDMEEKLKSLGYM